MDLERACKYGDVERCREILAVSDKQPSPEQRQLSPIHWLLLGMNNTDEDCNTIISMFEGTGTNHLADDVVMSGSNHLEKVSSVSPLHLSVLYKGAAVTRKLLSFHSNPNISDSNGDTPLIYACRLNNVEKVEILLHYGADVHSVNEKGESAYTVSTDERIRSLIVSRLDKLLVKSIGKDNDGCVTVELLLKAKADVNACDNTGRSALALSLKAGDLSSVLSLLEADNMDATSVDKTDEGLTVLHELALSSMSNADKVEVVHELLFRKADVNAKSGRGVTPLDLCLSSGQSDLAKILQENGASLPRALIREESQVTDGELSPSFPSLDQHPGSPPASTDHASVNLTEIAAKVGSLFVELNSARASVDGISSSPNFSNPVEITQMVTTESDLIAQKIELLNKLNMYLSEFERVKAAKNRDFKSIGLFMELQKLISDTRDDISNVNHRIDTRDFAIEAYPSQIVAPHVKSSWFRSPDSIEADIEAQIRIIRKSTGQASGVEGAIFEILKACQTSDTIPVIKLLRNRGAEANFCEDVSGTSCLMLAAEGDSEELVGWLISNSADLACVQKNSGMTCLHIAALKGNLRICRLMVDKGARSGILTIRDKLGRTPLDLCNNTAVSRILDPATSA